MFAQVIETGVVVASAVVVFKDVSEVVAVVVDVVVVVAGEHTRRKLPVPTPRYSVGQVSKQLPFNRYF